LGAEEGGLFVPAIAERKGGEEQKTFISAEKEKIKTHVVIPAATTKKEGPQCKEKEGGAFARRGIKNGPPSL